MLGDHEVMATLAVSDIDRAKAFYGDRLGLVLDEEQMNNVLIYRAGASRLLVYQSDYAGTNQATAATWSVGAAFDAVITRLREAGIVFERYDWPGATWKDGVHDLGDGFLASWFKDPDGNILHVNAA
ncbi:MAG: VOC family protein [Bauldia sp.]|nr:VOC family protein [Bauldia sp.]